ncbi:MAG: CapA family protein [Prevotellaceae bacterium]|jgi:poly-gamma-glutamate synthesis protein (capsule biosynthesis protein)|nr:CapA family protein [Prevotellaceae bacterium]
MRTYTTILVCLFCLPELKSQDTLNLLFIGDVMAHQKQIDAAKTDSGYFFTSCFEFVKPYLAEADVTVANLEVTLAGEPYSGYPAFSAPDELATALQQAGVDVLLTANNHACDKGRKGVERTIGVLDTLQFMHTGTFYDNIHRSRTYPLLLKKNNITVGLLNYTYGTNDIPTPEPAVVNRIDTAQMAADIALAKSLSPDIIAVAIHWGEEYKLYANRAQRAIADFLLRQGVRLVIGSHPHVLQGMEMNRTSDTTVQSAVVYSLGNFISNMTAVNTEIGVMVRIRLIKKHETTHIDRGDYIFTWVYKPEENNMRRFYVLPAAVYAGQPGFFAHEKEYRRMKASLDAMRKLYRETTTEFVEYIE